MASARKGRKAKPAKATPSRVTGVRRDGDRWFVRWTEGSQRRCFARRDRDLVEAKREELLCAGAPLQVLDSAPTIVPDAKADAAALELPNRGPFNGTPAWFKQAFADVFEASRQAANVGDGRRIDAWRRYGRLLSDLSHAWQPYSAAADVQAELEELTSYVESLHAGRATLEDAGKSTATAEPAATLAGAERPGTPLRRPGDPVPN
jgi:hypothetical protein